jgi:hypothetical protein
MKSIKHKECEENGLSARFLGGGGATVLTKFPGGVVSTVCSTSTVDDPMLTKSAADTSYIQYTHHTSVVWANTNNAWQSSLSESLSRLP